MMTCVFWADVCPGKILSLLQIYSFQDMLVAENPNLVSKIVIGRSFEGRPLNVLKVQGSPESQKYCSCSCSYCYFCVLVQHRWIQPSCHLDRHWNPLQRVGHSGQRYLVRQEGAPMSSVFILRLCCYWPLTSCTVIMSSAQIVTDFGRNAALTAILNNMDIFLEIVTNPDGFHFTHNGVRAVIIFTVFTFERLHERGTT